MTRINRGRLFEALDQFKLELPSWAFADGGTRFGVFKQDAAASSIEQKLEDAAICNELTGTCPSVAVHYLWDFGDGSDPAKVARMARKLGLRIGAINPTLFQDPLFKLGSLASPDGLARQAAVAQLLDCVKLAKRVGSKIISLWFADGTNFPGQDNLTRRKHHMLDGLRRLHKALAPGMEMLIEYKPFEPAFYHTDIADWGMAAMFARQCGPKAKVLVDTGHHLPGANIEHIVAFLLDEGLLGGFHLNDKKYADDDLTLASIDPYAVFRIFNVIAQHEHDTGRKARIAYMIDQSHTLKPKVEEMIQTVDRAQRLFAKAQLVDRDKLAKAQAAQDVVAAEECLLAAYETDVRPLVAAWRKTRRLPADPLAAFRKSGYQQRAADRRTALNDIPF